MIALGLSIALFAFWLFVGRAVLTWIGGRYDSLQSLLLAPITGLAATVLPLLWINRLGVPVEHFGPGLTVVLTTTAALLLAWRRPVIPWRQYIAITAILVAGLLLIGSPALEYGLDWISYANDDMANYVLLAQQLLHHGFFDQPDISTLVDGRDYSQIGWFFHVVFNVRPGAQLILAWTQSQTGLTGHQVFMPTILSFHLILISTTAAMVYAVKKDHIAASVAAAIVATSALTAQGTLNQLIAQVVGLGLLAGSSIVLLSPFVCSTWRSALREGMLIAVMGSALCTCYPEVLPFLGLGLTVYFIVGGVRRAIPIGPTARVLSMAAIGGLVFLNSFLPSVLQFLLSQFATTSDPRDVEIAVFPAFLVPSGLADLWGFQRLDALAEEPLRSASTLLGALVFAAGIGLAVAFTWRRYPCAIIVLEMVALGAILASERAAFGLFKLAMFIQPFVLATFTLASLRLARRSKFWMAPVLALGLGGLPATVGYINASRGQSTSVEVLNGSAARINDEFQQVLAILPPGPLRLDTTNITLETFQVVYTRGRDTTFPSRDLLSGIFTPCSDRRPSAEVRLLIQTICDRSVDATFALLDPAHPDVVNPFKINTVGEDPAGRSDCQALIATTGRQTVFNRRRLGESSSTDFVAYPCGVANHLIFVDSRLGQDFFRSDQQHVGIFGLEEEPLWHVGTMAGVGRHLLFYVVNPSASVRLALTFTASLKGDGENSLPPAAAIGSSRESFPFVGRGSARVFSPPLQPQMIDGRPYVAIDMGVDGRRFAEERSGVMALYGMDVPLDSRKLTGFARDISLVSDADYATVSAPSGVTSFPDGLFQPDLEYSGVYEDGWVGEDAFLNLSQTPDESTLEVNGVLAALDQPGPSDVRLLVDGAEVLHRTIEPGDFDLRVPAPSGSGRRHVELQFSLVQHLPAPDSRPVTALLRSVGFESTIAETATTYAIK